MCWLYWRWGDEIYSPIVLIIFCNNSSRSCVCGTSQSIKPFLSISSVWSQHHHEGCEANRIISPLYRKIRDPSKVKQLDPHTGETSKGKGSTIFVSWYTKVCEPPAVFNIWALWWLHSLLPSLWLLEERERAAVSAWLRGSNPHANLHQSLNPEGPPADGWLEL